jgi:hypothetical protein
MDPAEVCSMAASSASVHLGYTRGGYDVRLCKVQQDKGA